MKNTAELYFDILEQEQNMKKIFFNIISFEVKEIIFQNLMK